MSITLGRYRHYKGREYQVIGIARHSETLEEMVIYEPLYPSQNRYWVRPLKMFTETVLVNGKQQPRFAKIEESSS